MDDPNKYNIKTFKNIKDFVIEITYEDGKTQIIDFQKINYRSWWKELEDPSYFKKVRIDEIANLSWPNGQDFLPEHLYYWEKYQHLYTSPNN
ncbi:MAG: DUF2442 domain-containing protein [Candidatus Protochlamydia sp.]|nr:DUF2442 domain-containing protein [Candidatus Protochlamydia sp.]